MLDYDSDSSGGIERVCSVTSLPPKSYDHVPETMEFQFKFFGVGCSRSGTKLIFPLKKDKPLPYLTKTLTKKGRGMHYAMEEYELNCLVLSFRV